MRLLDTRSGAMPTSGSQTAIVGRPNSTAVVSIVATETSAAGYVQVLACGAAPGASSNLNADAAGQTRAGLAVVRFGADGRACVFAQRATHLVVDLQGYLDPAGVDDVDDQRLVDTRSGDRPGDRSRTEVHRRPNSWSSLPLTVDEIDRIEVVRGTNSNAYGANAFLGVVNINTRHSHQGRGVTVQTNLGSHGISDLRASWTGGSDDTGMRLTASRLQDNGFSRLNDSRVSQTVSLRSDHRVNATDELTVRAGYSRLERGMGYPDSIYNNNGERTANAEVSTLHLTWRRTFRHDEEWLISFYRNHEASIDRWTASSPSFPVVPLNRDRSSNRTNIELQHRFALTSQARMVWGLEGRRDDSKGSFLFFGSAPPEVNMYRAFSNFDWHLTPAWQLNFGGLLEKNGDVATQFIPRAFLNWQASPSDTFRMGYARAWQQRNMFDIYGDVRVFASGTDPRTGTPVRGPTYPTRICGHPRSTHWMWVIWVASTPWTRHSIYGYSTKKSPTSSSVATSRSPSPPLS